MFLCSVPACDIFFFLYSRKKIIRSLYFIIYQEEMKIKELYNHKPTRKGMCMLVLPSMYLIIVVIIIIIGCVRNGEKKKHWKGLEIRIF